MRNPTEVPSSVLAAEQGGYRRVPLRDLVRYIHCSPHLEQLKLASDMGKAWKERTDLWLYRLLVPGYLGLQIDGNSLRILPNLFRGLSSENPLLRTTTVALASLLDHDHANVIKKDRAGLCNLTALWDRLRGVRWNNLSLRSIEQSLLRVLVMRAISNLALALNPGSRITITAFEGELNNLEQGLRDINKEWFPGQPLVFKSALEAERKTAPACVPWDAAFYGVELAETIRHFVGKWRFVNEPSRIAPNLARTLVGRLRTLQQTAWLTVREARRFLSVPTTGKHTDGQTVDERKLITTERQALADLSLLERATGDSVRAGIYAMLALELQTAKAGNLLNAAIQGALNNIAIQIGFDVPGKTPRTKAQQPQGQSTTPVRRATPSPESLLDRSLVADPDVLSLIGNPIREDISAIIAKTPDLDKGTRRVWERLIHSVAENPDDYTEKDREHIFELAVRLNAIRRAGQIAVPLDHDGERWTPAEGKSLRLTGRLIVMFARAITTTYQEAIPWVDHQIFLGLRMNLRRMWKVCHEEIGFHDLIAIHDALRGQFHAVADRVASTSVPAFGAYLDLTNREKSDLREGFADRIVRGLVPPESCDDIGPRIASIPEGTVFVSIAIRNGHELSVLLATGNGKKRHWVMESTEKDVPEKDGTEDRVLDWHELTEGLSGTQPIWAVARIGRSGAPGRVPWPQDFIKLGRRIIDNVVAMDPHANCMAFATASKMRGLPWQHLVSVVLREYWRYRCEKQGILRGHIFGDGLLVRHVSGLASFLTKDTRESTRIFKVGIELAADKNEKVYQRLKADVEATYRGLKEVPNGSRIRSVLIVFAQGSKDKHFSRILFDGEPINGVMKDELVGYAFTLINVCHSGYFEENMLGDLGGWPGYLLSHQGACVVAPISEIADVTASRFFKYIDGWLRDDRKTFSQMYLTAIIERADMAFYSVFGDPSIVDAMK